MTSRRAQSGIVGSPESIRLPRLDSNMIEAAGNLITNHVERSESNKAYKQAQELVKRHPESADAHFTLAYVLRYAGLLEEAGHECDVAIALAPGNFTFRSCAWSFSQLGKTGRAMDFIRLDAGSEWSNPRPQSICCCAGV
jgi:uncharacterized protein HemY